MSAEESDETTLSEIARKLIKGCLKIQQNEMVYITCGEHNIFFAELIARECYECGAPPLIGISNLSTNYSKLLMNLPAEKLKCVPAHLVSEFEKVTCFISINPIENPLLFENIPRDQMLAMRIASTAILEKITTRNIKWASLQYPTRETASYYEVSFDKLKEIVFSSMNIDYDDLVRRVEALAQLVKDTNTIHITSHKGTDLRISVKDRQWFGDNGTINKENSIRKRTGVCLPAGEVYVACLEDDTVGTAVIDSPVYYHSHHIDELKLSFRHGKIVDSCAKSSIDLFNYILRRNRGDVDKVGEFAFGLNPKITFPIGDPSLDEKMIGGVHIALGDNRSFGGNNKSTLHLDLMISKATVYVDNQLVLRDGVFQDVR
jgi:leucyl aminopeptidase (aminopeptidase T)